MTALRSVRSSSLATLTLCGALAAGCVEQRTVLELTLALREAGDAERVDAADTFLDVNFDFKDADDNGLAISNVNNRVVVPLDIDEDELTVSVFVLEDDSEDIVLFGRSNTIGVPAVDDVDGVPVVARATALLAPPFVPSFVDDVLPQGRLDAAVCSDGERAFVAGAGRPAARYRVGDARFEEVPTPLDAVRGAACVIDDGEVILLGGCDELGDPVAGAARGSDALNDATSPAVFGGCAMSALLVPAGLWLTNGTTVRLLDPDDLSSRGTATLANPRPGARFVRIGGSNDVVLVGGDGAATSMALLRADPVAFVEDIEVGSPVFGDASGRPFVLIQGSGTSWEVRGVVSGGTFDSVGVTFNAEGQPFEFRSMGDGTYAVLFDDAGDRNFVFFNRGGFATTQPATRDHNAMVEVPGSTLLLVGAGGFDVVTRDDF